MGMQKSSPASSLPWPPPKLTYPLAGRRNGAKTRLYLARPEPDIVTSRRRVTRIIPPTPPPCEEPIPVPVVEEPAPEPCPCPPAPCPSPPALPAPEPQIEVIAVDVEPRVKSAKSSRSRSRSRSHVREKEVYVKRDRFIPVPVPVPVPAESRYETYRYVEAPRRCVEPPRERKMIEDNQERVTHVHVHTEDREASRDRRPFRDRDYYDREYYETGNYGRR
ncbi:uncharacterized protein MAM_06842 [Metarhizium album ARSEF 1941]|uniref:Uncharacterized protein n=1 Tax=Metarhizium album (strain ARSEF 1941) TaxID=1081103 RepID=A0A0B2WN39_METAS|nr:uncharacterized protein MAM_06842 [Metarhizium album ARSEF 1941]KHN95338.1 hypothetical protein MAM_06842 [Metarhizium album ARSEF 1941]